MNVKIKKPKKRRFQAAKLLRLATFLETINKDKFNIRVWMRKELCGTVGCAAGWAATMPEFVKEGLNLEKPLGSSLIGAVPRYNGVQGMAAMDAFFGLSSDESDHLFLPAKYRFSNASPKTVAKRIRRLVASKQKATKSP